ncbi:CoA transferase [Phenylobacterium sp.]|uniref:CoA transferase n=1 Tax=Phenylobacterium sp. TaxID=1871053 RepID=UPI00301C36D5
MSLVQREIQDDLQDILNVLGFSGEHAGASIQIAGEDPVLQSRLRLGRAATVAMGAHAAGVASIWRMRTGRRQTVGLSVREAANALNAGAFVRQGGYPAMSRQAMSEPVSGVFRAGDGRWILLSGPASAPRLRNGLLELLDCPNTRSKVEAAVARRSALELEEACVARDLAATMIRTPEEWAAHPQSAFLASRPLIEIEKIGDSPPEPLGPGPRPLSGVRAIDAAHVLAGPISSRCLAEHGADVMRISSPYRQDHFSTILDTCIGKRSTYFDLNTPEGGDGLRRLAAEADVFVQSYSPGGLARKGFGAEDLAALRPGVIYAQVSCFGQEPGPWARRIGFDTNAQAAAGVFLIEGDAERPRGVPTTLMADYLTAYLAAAGILAALRRRAVEGGSWRVNVSLARTIQWVLSLGVIPGELGGSPLEDLAATARVLRAESAYGEIEHLAPVALYSETPAYWSRAVSPLGSSPPQWLPR